MKIENLLMLGSAHGIDLMHVAGSAIETDKLAKQRRRTHVEKSLGMWEVRNTATGNQSRVTRKPVWSVAELAQAMGNVPRMAFLAACFSIWGDTSVYAELHRGLMYKALKLMEEKSWPLELERRDGGRRYYTSELCGLVLDLDAHKPFFTAAPTLYSWYMDVGEDVWDKKVKHWQQDLSYQLERWVGLALGMGAARLREDDAA